MSNPKSKIIHNLNVSIFKKGINLGQIEQAIEFISPTHLNSLMSNAFAKNEIDIINAFANSNRLNERMTMDDFNGVGYREDALFHPLNWTSYAIAKSIETNLNFHPRKSFLDDSQKRSQIDTYSQEVRDACLQIFRRQYESVSDELSDEKLANSFEYSAYRLASAFKDERFLAVGPFNIENQSSIIRKRSIINAVLNNGYPEIFNEKIHGSFHGYQKLDKVFVEHENAFDENNLGNFCKLMLKKYGSYFYDPKNKKSVDEFVEFHSTISGSKNIHHNIKDLIVDHPDLFAIDFDLFDINDENNKITELVYEWARRGIIGFLDPEFSRQIMGKAIIKDGVFQEESTVWEILRTMYVTSNKSYIVDKGRTICSLMEHVEDIEPFIKTQPFGKTLLNQCIDEPLLDVIAELTAKGLTREDLEEGFKKYAISSNVTPALKKKFDVCLKAHETKLLHMRAQDASDYARNIANELKSTSKTNKPAA